VNTKEERDTRFGEPLAGGLLAGHDKAWKDISKRVVKDGSKLARATIRHVPGVPSKIYDVATFAGAKDKKRELVSLVGGGMGAAVGGVLGGPIGAAGGSVAGEMVAEGLYDPQDDIRWKMRDTKRWIEERELALAREAARTFLPMDRMPPLYQMMPPVYRRGS
jgi:hypothetical protein